MPKVFRVAERKRPLQRANTSAIPNTVKHRINAAIGKTQAKDTRPPRVCIFCSSPIARRQGAVITIAPSLRMMAHRDCLEPHEHLLTHEGACYWLPRSEAIRQWLLELKEAIDGIKRGLGATTKDTARERSEPENMEGRHPPLPCK
jgi:hypothetical protein